MREYTIPLLPCNSIDVTLEFYKALGFDVTYQQKIPNAYAAVKLRAIELHFFALKQLKPENNFSSCYIMVDSIDSMYESFTTGLRKLFNKLPIRGVPRVNPLKNIPAYGVRQFIVVDPSGNYIRVGQPIQKTDSLVFTENNKNKEPNSVPLLEKTYELASRLADAKGDFASAAKMLDKAIETKDTPEEPSFLRILILRADVAIRMEDYASAANLLGMVQSRGSLFTSETMKEELRLYEELQTLLKEK